MSREASEAVHGAAPSPAPALHPRSFKLRFAAQRELGRSHISAVKPLALPATVTGKLQLSAEGEVCAAREACALSRVSDMFRLGPRDKYPISHVSSHEYGWWCEHGGRWHESSWLHHHICDSAWLKERLRVLAADASYKRC
ncbi:unnamed protein product [Colias eurytheme]|nr:unnamed protein product [Colias eurytheme]